MARLGRQGLARLGRAGLGTAWHGKAGRAGFGVAWQGKARQARQGIDNTLRKGTEMEEEASIQLKPIHRETAHIEIKGTAPLIVHAWTQKARIQMLDNMTGRKKAKEPKDPISEYEGSMYRFADGGHGFPVLAFKAAAVSGARYFNGVTMTQMRQAMFMQGDPANPVYVRLNCSEPHMREDTVRIGLGSDIRYRAQYDEWSAILTVVFVPSVISFESITALVDAGGMGGIGEWRPEKSGAYGTYAVVRA